MVMQKIFGLICLICGIVLIVLALYPLVLPLILLMIGLYAVNYGLRLMHRPTIWRGAQMWYWQRRP